MRTTLVLLAAAPLLGCAAFDPPKLVGRTEVVPVTPPVTALFALQEQNATVVTVRLLDESGEPWREELSARVAESMDQGHCDEWPARMIQPDSEGMVSVKVYWHDRPVGLHRFSLLHLRHESEGVSRHWVTGPISPTDAESLDLGVLRLGDTAFVSGRIADPRGTPLDGLWLYVVGPKKPGASALETVRRRIRDRMRVTTGADGEFAIWLTPGNEISGGLSVGPPGWPSRLMGTHEEIEPYSHPMTIRLASVTGVAGEVLLPSSIVEHVIIQLVWEGPLTSDGPLKKRAVRRNSNNGEFVEGATVGPYSLLIRDRASDLVLYRSAEFEVVRNKVTELGTLDLRNTIRPFVITVLSEDGTKHEAPFVHSSDLEWPPGREPAPNPVTVAAPLGAEVTISARGHRDQVVTLSSTQQTVLLDAGITREVAFDGFPTEVQNARMIINVSPVPPSRTRSNPIEPIHEFSFEMNWQPRAELRFPAPGHWAISLSLLPPDATKARDAVHVGGVFPRIEGGDSAAPITLPVFEPGMARWLDSR